MAKKNKVYHVMLRRDYDELIFILHDCFEQNLWLWAVEDKFGKPFLHEQYLLSERAFRGDESIDEVFENEFIKIDNILKYKDRLYDILDKKIEQVYDNDFNQSEYKDLKDFMYQVYERAVLGLDCLDATYVYLPDIDFFEHLKDFLLTLKNATAALFSEQYVDLLTRFMFYKMNTRTIGVVGEDSFQYISEGYQYDTFDKKDYDEMVAWGAEFVPLTYGNVYNMLFDEFDKWYKHNYSKTNGV